jgi:hypothetical protein
VDRGHGLVQSDGRCVRHRSESLGPQDIDTGAISVPDPATLVQASWVPGVRTCLRIVGDYQLQHAA